MQQIADVDTTKTDTRPRTRRIVRWALITAFSLVILAGLGMYGATVYFIHKAFTHRVQGCKTVPEDLGLIAETIALTSSDGIPLKAWWVAAEAAPRCGLGASRNGRT